ncbi:MAG TPA: HAD family hydrolase [Anaerolineae bacterium]|nr:HAD family hydrolase [Anaerolineae bacterium]
MLRRAVFLDKDGTLVENVPYNVDPGRIRLMPGAARALSRLRADGYLLIVVSNQSGVARGYFSIDALHGVEERLRELLAEAGAGFDGFYYCPHHPEGSVEPYAIDCSCRKPNPGLITRAAQEHGVDLARSWLVGDILDDVEAGRRAGCRTILLDNGNETEWLLSARRLPHYLAPGLLEAETVISAVDAALGPTVLSTLRLLRQRARRSSPPAGGFSWLAPHPHAKEKLHEQ